MAKPIKYLDSGRYVELTPIAMYMVQGDTNVVLVLSGYGFDAAFWDAMSVGGNNLVFTDVSGNRLYADKVVVNKAANTMQVHVLVPNISIIAPISIYAQVGGSFTQSSDTQTWTVAGYTSVWPMDGDNIDRCGLNNLTPVGNLPNITTGAIGSAQSFDANSYYDIADTTTYINSTGSRVSFWVSRPTLFGTQYPIIGQFKTDLSNGFLIFSATVLYPYLTFGSNAGFLRYGVNQAFTALTKVSLNIDSASSYRCYYNGVLQSLVTSPDYAVIPQVNMIGSWSVNTAYKYRGVLDHFTVEAGQTRSAAWELREYNNQSAFLTNGVWSISATKRFGGIIVNIPFQWTTRCLS